MKRLTSLEYASHAGVHVKTVNKWCRNAALPPGEKNRLLPPMVARKQGRDWKIDLEETERAQSLVGGTGLERELVRKRMM